MIDKCKNSSSDNGAYYSEAVELSMDPTSHYTHPQLLVSPGNEYSTAMVVQDAGVHTQHPSSSFMFNDSSCFTAQTMLSLNGFYPSDFSSFPNYPILYSPPLGEDPEMLTQNMPPMMQDSFASIYNNMLPTSDSDVPPLAYENDVFPQDNCTTPFSTLTYDNEALSPMFECETPAISIEQDSAEGLGKSLDNRELKDERPPHSYATLIAHAINSSPQKCLTVSEIYEWFLEHYPYFRHTSCPWKNSIRHNLTMKRLFVRVRPVSGKGGLWALDYSLHKKDMSLRSFSKRRQTPAHCSAHGSSLRQGRTGNIIPKRDHQRSSYSSIEYPPENNIAWNNQEYFHHAQLQSASQLFVFTNQCDT
ncbi:uncharacterized protein VTP21DRAFT_6677 [Calcarisporiella thermophila]|uniref:uncharacterized protein n=1 Tax=Calcarisporiella thermophila TaxID=911321 RepID=UPI003742081D